MVFLKRKAPEIQTLVFRANFRANMLCPQLLLLHGCGVPIHSAVYPLKSGAKIQQFFKSARFFFVLTICQLQNLSENKGFLISRLTNCHMLGDENLRKRMLHRRCFFYFWG